MAMLVDKYFFLGVDRTLLLRTRDDSQTTVTTDVVRMDPESGWICGIYPPNPAKQYALPVLYDTETLQHLN
jgi:hypothetical protein